MNAFGIKQTTLPKAPVTSGRIIVTMPTLEHVKALQFLLKDNGISQEEPIRYEDFIANPSDYPDKTRLIWLFLENPMQIYSVMDPLTMFMCDEIFALVGRAVIVTRDQSGKRWGVNDGPSTEHLGQFWDAFAYVNR